MIYLDGLPIFKDAIDIIKELKFIYNESHDYGLFDDIKDTNNNIMVTCPFHKNGKERSPSFGIRKSDLVCHCFTCGWAGSFTEFINKLYNKPSDSTFGREFTNNYYVNLSVDDGGRELSFELSRDKKDTLINYISEDELDSYRYIHPYMFERGLNEELINRFDVGYDIHTDELTFPVKELSGNVVFIARRHTKIKRFHYPVSSIKPVYGANELVDNSHRRVMICESILNALTGWKYNLPSIALLGTGTKNQYDILRKLPVRHYVIATDPDEAGEKAAQKLINELGNYKVLSRLVIPKGEDINSLDKEFLNLDEYFC